MTKFNRVYDRIFWALSLGVCSFATHYIVRMSDAIDDLNRKVSVLVYQSSENDRQYDECKTQVDKLARRVDHIEDRSRL